MKVLRAVSHCVSRQQRYSCSSLVCTAVASSLVCSINESIITSTTMLPFHKVLRAVSVTVCLGSKGCMDAPLLQLLLPPPCRAQPTALPAAATAAAALGAATPEGIPSGPPCIACHLGMQSACRAHDHGRRRRHGCARHNVERVTRQESRHIKK